MAFLFLLKMNSLGGNYSIEIGVRSSLNIISTSVFPFVNCKGVTDAMGLPISLNDYVMVACVPRSLDVSNGVSPTSFEGIST